MPERTWQNLNHLVWRMQASKYPVLLLLTPDCFVLDCGWLFDCHRLWKFDKHFLFVCVSFRVSARVWLIFLLLFAQLSSKQLHPPPLPPPFPLPLPASCLLWLYPHEFVCRKNFGCSCQDSPSIFLITRVMWWIYKFLSLSSISPLSLCVCVCHLCVCVLGIINSSLSCVVELPSSISLSFRGSPQWHLFKPTLSAISRVRLHMTMAFITIAPIKCSQHMSGWMCAAGAQGSWPISV